MNEEIRSTEGQEQEALFTWCQNHDRRYPELRWLYAIPNGMAARSPITAARMRRQGMRKGIPDICLPVARGRYHGLYIELKRRGLTAAAVTPSQKDCLTFLRAQGYLAEVCFGWEQAIEFIRTYLDTQTIQSV